MKLFISIFIFIYSFNLIAGTQIERLNFFPNADQFSYLRYNYEKTKIDSQVRVVGTKELNNFSNTLYFSYAHKLYKNYFLGLTIPYQSAIESGVEFGIPVSNKYTSYGFKEPELFTIIKLREETEDEGLIYLYLSYSNKMGKAKTGGNNANRLSGRNIFKSELSHGKNQELWEFKTYLRFEYYSLGNEKDLVTSEEVTLSSYSDLKVGFKTQYNYTEPLSFIGGIGILYRGTRNMLPDNGGKREVQAGTGSFFELSAKYRFNDKNILELSGSIERNDYFVKADENNFDGHATVYLAGVNYTRIY